jgi:Tol biopolymer transport system component
MDSVKTAIGLGGLSALLLAGCGAAWFHSPAIQEPEKHGHPRSQMIVFTAKRDNNWEIYSLRPDTGAINRLTRTFPEEEGVASSRDGSRLAFVSRRDGDYEIYVMNLDGTDQQRLTFTKGVDEKPVWLNDDAKILFESARDGNWEIYIMNSDGSGQVNLSQTAVDEADPILSPDGRRIAFKSLRDGEWKLYVMDVDGGNVVPLANSGYKEGDYDDPAWSPDGGEIAFVSDREGSPQIYKMTVPREGAATPGLGPVRRLTGGFAAHEDPVWSPGGDRILFVSKQNGIRKVFVMNRDGSGIRPLGPIPVETGSPQWSYDGQWVAYIARSGTIPYIQLVNAADGSHDEIVMDGTEMAELHWIPGEWLLTQAR